MLCISPRLLWLLLLVLGFSAGTVRAEGIADLAAELTPLLEKHEGEVAVMLKHLPSGEVFEYRAEQVQSTASLCKLPLLMAMYQAADEGKVSLDTMIELTEEDKVPGSGILTTHFSPGLKLSLRDAARLMIAYSDNTATNLVVDQVGLEPTRQLMQSLGCGETQIHSKVYRRDTTIDLPRSQKYGLGSTSPREMVKLLELLHAKEFVSEKVSSEILKHMEACTDSSQVKRDLPPGTKVAHKTGAVSDIRADAGIISLKDGAILYCVQSQKNKDNRWAKDSAAELLAAKIGKLAFEHFTGDAKSTTEAKPSTPSVLELGASGEMVEALQRTLNARLKPSPELSVDGDFGPMTETAVLRFQTENRLEANGKIDRAFWQALGPIVAEEEEQPIDIAQLNAEELEKQPADPLSGIPLVTCKAWIIVDGHTGEKLAGHEEEVQRNPASVTKIMTALLVLELAEKSPEILDEVITFSQRADDTVGSTAALKAGEKVTVGELLYGLMLPSGNDASVAFGEHFGDRLSPDPEKKGYDGFIAAMNQRAQAIGMKNTGYRNTHGLTARGHLTTAADMALLAREAMKLERFCKIVSTRRHATQVETPEGAQRNVVWRNTNQLLGQEGYLGVKTGTTSAAGACLVSCAERDERRLIMVVLGASSSDARYTDSRNLYRWIWNDLVGGDVSEQQETPMPKPTEQSSTTKPRGEIVLTDKAQKLHSASIVIDGHNDLPWEIRNRSGGDFTKLDLSQPQPKIHTDIPRLRAGGVGAQFWSVWVPVSLGYEGIALLTTIEQIELVKKMVETYPQDFELATTVADIRRIQKEGKIASLIGVEGGHCIEDSISNLNHLFQLGARYMTLTHADSLDWADSATDQPKAQGLSPFGKQVIEQMNRLGMMVDISHVSPETMHAVLDITKAPVIFSHSSARAVADSPRNVPDDVLKRIKEEDGVVMVNYFSAFVVPEAVEIYHEGLRRQRELSEKHEPAEVSRMMTRWRRANPMPPGDIHDVLDHIDHLAKIAGWQHVGIGSDYDGVSLLPKGLEDVSTYPYITQGLLDRGYTEEQITGILGENLLRVMGQVEQVGAELRGE